MTVNEILRMAVDYGASDIFVTAGLPLTFKVKGSQVRREEDGRFTPEMTRELALEICELAKRAPDCVTEPHNQFLSCNFFANRFIKHIIRMKLSNSYFLRKRK